MRSKVKIALAEPGREMFDRYFSVRIKVDLHNEPTEYSKPDRILIIANVEGRFSILRKLLLRAGVIDKSYQWTFQDGHVVIMGNFLGNGPEMVECLWLIYSLEERAKRRGGYIHFLLGGQEIMGLWGNWRYLQPKYANVKSSSNTPYVALYDGNNELWRWLHTKNIVEKIGDILFLNENISRDIIKLPMSITAINAMARVQYTMGHTSPFNISTALLKNGEYPLRSQHEYCTERAAEGIADADTLSKFNVSAVITERTQVESLHGRREVFCDEKYAVCGLSAFLL